MGKPLTIALAGNPNSGKTTLFNRLTKARQHVGNYPGVTVELKEGHCRHESRECRVVDLPGTYSLTAYSAEELVARNFLVGEKPDVVVDVLDASNLERNLYLAVQLLELGVPLVLAFNMSDMAKSRGLEFDLEKLSRFFGAPIVETVGHKGSGTADLLAAAVAVADGERQGQRPVFNYGREIEAEIATLIPLLSECAGYEPRWIALKLLERDREVVAAFASEAVSAQLARSTARIESIAGESPETAIAGRRYGFISGACQEAVRSTIEFRHNLSDRIDAVVTNRVLGIPLFLGLMYLVFQLTFTVGEAPMGWIESFFASLGETLRGWWPDGGGPLAALLTDGVIGGVGGVLVFLPNILLLFLAIAILEDSGYMARAAFIMDRVMHRIGLHGKSFIPMLIGFGCSVPAIMATRTLENRRDRITTMLVLPLVSCGARLPIYALLIPAFFTEAWHGPMLWIIYVTGLVLAVLGAKLLRRTLLKGEATPFVMELPPYRMPTLRGILTHMWERGWLYLKKAGTVILGISILLWFLTSYPKPDATTEAAFAAERQAVETAFPEGPARKEATIAVENRAAENALAGSFAGRIGRTIEPLLAPLGFDWKIGTALIGAFAAKEVFVAQMGIVYAVGGKNESPESLREKLRAAYSPLVGFCIMLFCLVSAPCMATIAVTRRESNSWRWALFQLAALTLLAWLLTFIVYQAGSLLGIGR